MQCSVFRSPLEVITWTTLPSPLSKAFPHFCSHLSSGCPFSIAPNRHIHIDTEYPSPVRARKPLGVFPRSFKIVTKLDLSIYSNTFVEVAEIISLFPILEILALEGS